MARLYASGSVLGSIRCVVQTVDGTSVRAVALVLTLIAIAIGAALGVRGGGEVSNIGRWQPPLWQALVGGIVAMGVIDLFHIGGWFGSLVAIASTAAVLAFAVANVRIGGMVVIASGLVLNLVVTIFNWGRPVSSSALVSSGIVKSSEVSKLVLTGGRKLADGAALGFLGDVIPLPWGQVISIGDLAILVGTVLVTSSVLRRRGVPGGADPFSPHHGPAGYRNAMDVLGRGPAPRRGPGLHPSRLDGPKGRHRPQPGRRPR